MEIDRGVSEAVGPSDGDVERGGCSRLEYEALVVAYAMSRLDRDYLRLRGLRSWKEAFGEAAQALGHPLASFKHLRDEFDPIHGNTRRGWHQRPLRPSRQRVLADLCGTSDLALMELAAGILRRDVEGVQEAVDAIMSAPRIAQQVAERLRTGRLAEEHFLGNVERIVKFPPCEVLDCRNNACGYDFGIHSRPEVAIEVKGLRENRGDVLFTDREWVEAKARGSSYWLVVVGTVESDPCFRLIPDPGAKLAAKCRYQTTVAANWKAHVEVA